MPSSDFMSEKRWPEDRTLNAWKWRRHWVLSGTRWISCDLFENTAWFSDVTGLEYSIPICGISIAFLAFCYIQECPEDAYKSLISCMLKWRKIFWFLLSLWLKVPPALHTTLKDRSMEKLFGFRIIYSINIHVRQKSRHWDRVINFERLKICALIKFVGFPGVSAVKNSPANAGDTKDVGLIPGSGRSPGGGNSNPLQ